MKNLETLYERFAPMVYRRCRALLGNDDEAWDGVQEVFLRLAEQRADLVGVASPTAHLWRMATNYGLNRLKKEGRSVSLPAEEPADTRDSEDRRVCRVFLESLFSRVPDRTRELAWYRWVDQMTWEETAVASGLSVAGVRKHLAKFQKVALSYKEHVS